MGHLLLVKNRLPPALAEEPVRPLLTEAEIRGYKQSGELDWFHGSNQTDLGACCCDCCHTHGLNCGPRFPNVPNVNQCLTPQLFNSLCRLGFALSSEAVEVISRSGSLSKGWERELPRPSTT